MQSNHANLMIFTDLFEKKEKKGKMVVVYAEKRYFRVASNSLSIRIPYNIALNPRRSAYFDTRLPADREKRDIS
jgi:hypothetical protein